MKNYLMFQLLSFASTTSILTTQLQLIVNLIMQFENQTHNSLFPTFLQQQTNIEIFKLKSQLCVLTQQNHNLKRLNNVLMESVQQLSSSSGILHSPVTIVNKQGNMSHSQQIERIQSIYHQLVKSEIAEGVEEIQSKYNKNLEQMMNRYQSKFKDVLKELKQSVDDIKKTKQNQRKAEKEEKRIKRDKRNTQITDYTENLPLPLQPEAPQQHNISFMASNNPLTSRSRGNSYHSNFLTTLSQTYGNSWYKKL